MQGQSPGLRSVTVEDLVGSDQVQFPMALLKHVDPWQPAGGGDQSLLHGGWVHQLPVQDGAGGQSKGGEALLVCHDKCKVSQLLPYKATQ